MHPVLNGQHAWVNTSHSYQTFKHTGPQAFEFGCFRQHCWSQLHMIPNEDDMCVSAGQLERNECHRLCRLSSLVHQNELTGPGNSSVCKSQAISKVPITTSVSWPMLVSPIASAASSLFCYARRVPVSFCGHFLGRDSSHVRILDFVRGAIPHNV